MLTVYYYSLSRTLAISTYMTLLAHQCSKALQLVVSKGNVVLKNKSGHKASKERPSVSPNIAGIAVALYKSRKGCW